MVLERADGSFGGVAAMEVGRSELKIDLFRVHELLEGSGGFVVESLELWTEAARGKYRVGSFVCCESRPDLLCIASTWMKLLS